MNEDLQLETDHSTQTCHPVAMATWQRTTALINNYFSDTWAYQFIILNQLLEGGNKKTVVVPMRKTSSARPDIAVSVITTAGSAMMLFAAQLKEKQTKNPQKTHSIKDICDFWRNLLLNIKS